MGLKKRPLIKSFYSPHQIMGPHYAMFLDHYETSRLTNTENFEKKIAFKFKDENRAIIAGLYASLRDNGFYITGIDENGLMFAQVVSNDGILYNPDFSLDSDKKLTTHEIQQMRKECRNSLDVFEEVPTPSPDDFDLEDVPF